MQARMTEAEACRAAVAFAGDARAEVSEADLAEGAIWNITLYGDLRIARSGPAEISRRAEHGCRWARISFDANDPSRTQPLTVEAWDSF